MVSIGTQIQQWANIQAGERLVIENNTLVVKHKSKVTFWQWLTGKARLGHALEHMIAKVEKNRNALETSTGDVDLKGLSERVQEITDKYYGAHWKICTWLFGNDAKGKSTTLIEKLNGITTSVAPLPVNVPDVTIPIPETPPFQVPDETESELNGTIKNASQSQQDRFLAFAANNPPPPEGIKVDPKIFVNYDPNVFVEPFAGATDEIKNQWIIYICKNWRNDFVKSEDMSVHRVKPWFVSACMADLQSRPSGSERREVLDAILGLFVRYYAERDGVGYSLLDGGGMFFEEDVAVAQLSEFFRFAYTIPNEGDGLQSMAQNLLEEKKSQIVTNQALVLYLLDLERFDSEWVSIEHCHKINKEYIIPEILKDESLAGMYLDAIFAGAPDSELSVQEKIYWIFYAHCELDKKRQLLADLVTADPDAVQESVLTELLKFSEEDNFQELVDCVFQVVDLSDYDLSRCSDSQYPSLRTLVKRLDLSVDSQKEFFKKAALAPGFLVNMRGLSQEQVNVLEDVMNDSAKIWFKLIHDSQSGNFHLLDESQSRAFWNARYPFSRAISPSLCLNKGFIRRAAKNAINSVSDKQTIHVFLKSLLDTAKILPSDCISATCTILSDFTPDQMDALFPNAKEYALAFTKYAIDKRKQKVLETIVKVFGTAFLSEIVVDDFPDSIRASVYQLSFATTIEEAETAIAEICQ